MAKTKRRLVESGKDVAGLDEHFFVVHDMHGLMSPPDRFLVCRRDGVFGAATVVANFSDFDYAHFCAKQLSSYHEKYQEPEDDQP